MLVDTHAHLTDERLAPEAAEVVDRAKAAGVDWCVTIATDLDDGEAAIALAARFDSVFATVGIHPHAADTFNEDALARLNSLSTRPKVLAIGETGLDYHYDNSPRAKQKESFRAQLHLAAERDLPVVVHAREADEDVIEIIRDVAWRRGVLHCFSSGRALLEAALELGWYASFAGMITFSKWDGAELVRMVPSDRLLVETDSPYLAPVPHRGRRNEPAFVRLVAERAAEIRGVEPERLFAETAANAAAFYGLPLA